MDQKGGNHSHMGGTGEAAQDNQSSLHLPSPLNIRKNSALGKNRDNAQQQQKSLFNKGPSILDKSLQQNHNNDLLSGEAGEGGEGWIKLDQTKKELDDVVKDLDVKLNRVLDKQEYDYLNGYNMYVKKKERELRELIQKMSDKNSNSTVKDDRILNLEKRADLQRDQLIKSEQQKEDLRGKVKMWKVKAQEFEKDKDFLYKQVMDQKKKNRLLKIAVSRLQAEMDRGNIINEENVTAEKGDTFLTDLHLLGGSLENDAQNKNNVDNSILMLDQSILQSTLKDTSVLLSNKKPHKRYQSTTNGGVSRYANIPTENLKFTKFVDLLFKSKMHHDDQREELKKYVQAIETNYTEKIKEMSVQVDKLKRKIKNMNGDKATQVTEKNEFESLFVLCIEDTRRDIMKRRLKNELVNRKKQIAQIAQNEEDAKEFEESLLKLANLAKNRVKQTDFTMRDRCNMLDLFVNNEKTLLKMYEILFPHRANGNQATNRQQINNVASQQKSIDILKREQQSLNTSLDNSQYIKLDTTAETIIKESRFLPTINNSKILHDTSMYASQSNSKSDYSSLRTSQIK